MFLNNFNLTKQQNAEPFTYLYGYNGLNMNYIHDVYMNNCASLIEGATPSPSTSPTSSSVASDTGSLLMSPISMCSKANSNFMGYGDNATIENLAALQHQHCLAPQLEQVSTSAVDQPQRFSPRNRKLSQINNTNIAFPSIYRQDEISKSLKMFAMLTAYSNNPESAIINQQVSQSPVDAVMQDFASNGYISDELNRRPYGKHYCANSINQKSSCSNQQLYNNGIRATDNSPLSQQKLHSIQKQNVNNHFWKTLPGNVQQNYNPITVAAAAASDNIDYNCNQRKFCKRYNGTKNEKYVSAKHCVFCENNNEPEPVVKSHAVRDSLGRVLCPKLRTYVCPICKASGDMAHTVKYCPQKPIITMEDAIKAESFRLVRANCYKQQMKL